MEQVFKAKASRFIEYFYSTYILNAYQYAIWNWYKNDPFLEASKPLRSPDLKSIEQNYLYQEKYRNTAIPWQKINKNTTWCNNYRWYYIPLQMIQLTKYLRTKFGFKFGKHNIIQQLGGFSYKELLWILGRTIVQFTMIIS